MLTFSDTNIFIESKKISKMINIFKYIDIIEY